MVSSTVARLRCPISPSRKGVLVFWCFPPPPSRPPLTGGGDSASRIKNGQCKPRPPPPPPRRPLFSSDFFFFPPSAPLYSASPGVNDDASRLAEAGEKSGRGFPTALGMSRKRGGGREREREECEARSVRARLPALWVARDTARVIIAGAF